MDSKEIALEKIKLGHKKYITLLQAVIALSLGFFALSLRKEGESLPFLSSELTFYLGLLTLTLGTAVFFSKLNEKENEVSRTIEKKTKPLDVHKTQYNLIGLNISEDSIRDLIKQALFILQAILALIFLALTIQMAYQIFQIMQST